MRGKRAEINRLTEALLYSQLSREEFADKILALFPSLDEWVVVRECPELRGCSDIYNNDGCVDRCNRTGTIIRPLEWKDVPYLLSQLMIVNDIWNKCMIGCSDSSKCGSCSNGLWMRNNFLTLPDGGKVGRKGLR